MLIGRIRLSLIVWLINEAPIFVRPSSVAPSSIVRLRNGTRHRRHRRQLPLLLISRHRTEPLHRIPLKNVPNSYQNTHTHTHIIHTKVACRTRTNASVNINVPFKLLFSPSNRNNESVQPILYKTL